jgi:hypothetical protein
MPPIVVPTKKCLYCSRTGKITLTEEQVWQFGEWILKNQKSHIQYGLSSWNTDQREQWMTGTHPKCWDDMFQYT